MMKDQNCTYKSLLFKRLIFTAMILASTCLSPVHILASNGDVAQQYMAKGDAAAKQSNSSSAISFYLKARNQAIKDGNHKQQFWAIYKIGKVYFRIYEMWEASNYFYEALALCDDNKLGRKERASALYGIAGVYFEQNDYKRALTNIRQALSLAMQDKDAEPCLHYASNVALLYLITGNYKEAEKYINIGKSLLKPGHASDLARIHVLQALLANNKKDYDSVISISKYIIDNPAAMKEDQSSTLDFLINIYTQRGEYNKAEYYVRKAIKVSPLRNKPNIFSSASDLYRKQGDLPTALAYKDSALFYENALSKMRNQQLANNMGMKEDVMKMRLDMDRKATQLRYHQYVFWALLALAIGIAIVTWVFIRNERIKTRQAKQLMQLKLKKEKQDKELAEMQMRETELTAKYEKQLLQTSLEKKKHELSATAAYVSARNQLIQDLLKAFDELPPEQRQKKQEEIFNHLQQVLQQGKEDEDFFVKFESENPNFIHALQQRHPELSLSDLRFLSYVRMKLPTKDIAVFMNITPDSCKKRKTRVSKKLGLKDSSELYSYIGNI